MDTVHIFLQHYWWFIISLLGALLVFLLFVQGGQAMLYTIGRTETERNLIVNSLGRNGNLRSRRSSRSAEPSSRRSRSFTARASAGPSTSGC